VKLTCFPRSPQSLAPVGEPFSPRRNSSDVISFRKLRLDEFRWYLDGTQPGKHTKSYWKWP
jgi:hypothetical protein